MVDKAVVGVATGEAKILFEVSQEGASGMARPSLRWRPDKKPDQYTFEQLNQKIDRRLMSAVASFVRS
jgi:hypothetical protein